MNSQDDFSCVEFVEYVDTSNYFIDVLKDDICQK